MSDVGGGALACSLGKRQFLALLVAAASTEILGNEGDGTSEALCEGEREGYADDIKMLMKRAAKSGWTASRLEDMAKRTGGMGDEHAAILVAYWQREREGFMEALQKRSVLTNNSLHKLTWRADVKSRVSTTTQEENSEPVDESEAPTAIFQLETKLPNEKGGTNVVRFEMDRDQLAAFSAQLGAIKDRIASRA